MKLTPEDLQKLETKQVANVIRKLNAGKTLTAREEALLARSRETGSPEPVSAGPGKQPAAAPPGYAKTWDELAGAVGVDRRTLTNIRAKYGKKCPPDRADGRREVAAWIRFLDEIGVRGRGENNPEVAYIDEKALRLEERKLRVERERFELARAKDQTVPLAHVEAALGHMLARFRQALDALPGRIASAIDEADRDALLAMLTRAQKAKSTITQLKRQLASGKAQAFTDFHARRDLVQAEIDQLLRLLTACEYMEGDPDAEED